MYAVTVYFERASVHLSVNHYFMLCTIAMQRQIYTMIVREEQWSAIRTMHRKNTGVLKKGSAPDSKLVY